MGIRTGNPAWVDSATEAEAQANPGRKITAAKLNAIEAAIDDSAEAGHQHDDAIPSGLVDAKGDLIVATADNAVTRLPAGTNGHVLTADSTEAAGVKWAAPSGGGGVTVPLQGGKLTGGWAINGTRKNLPITAGQMFAFPLAIQNALTITSAEINVNVASATGAVRIGIFSMGANGTGTLLADFGTLPTNATGNQSLTGLTVSASAGLYWLVAHADEVFTFGHGVSGVFTYGDVGVRACSANPLLARLAGTPTYAPLPATLPALSVSYNDNPIWCILPIFLGAA